VPFPPFWGSQPFEPTKTAAGPRQYDPRLTGKNQYLTPCGTTETSFYSEVLLEKNPRSRKGREKKENAEHNRDHMVQMPLPTLPSMDRFLSTLNRISTLRKRVPFLPPLCPFCANAEFHVNASKNHFSSVTQGEDEYGLKKAQKEQNRSACRSTASCTAKGSSEWPRFLARVRQRPKADWHSLLRLNRGRRVFLDLTPGKIGRITGKPSLPL